MAAALQYVPTSCSSMNNDISGTTVIPFFCSDYFYIYFIIFFYIVLLNIVFNAGFLLLKSGISNFSKSVYFLLHREQLCVLVLTKHKAVKGIKLQTLECLGHSNLRLESHVLDNSGRQILHLVSRKCKSRD